MMMAVVVRLGSVIMAALVWVWSAVIAHGDCGLALIGDDDGGDFFQ